MSDFHLRLEEQLPKLMRYATALIREPEEASELVEDTVSEALATKDQCPENNIRVWLLTLLHDLRDNPFRQANIAASSPHRDDEVVLTLSDLDNAMGRLVEEQRAVILLIGLEGMTYEQTAAILGIPVGTMRWRLARGRDGLRRALRVAAPAPYEIRAA